MAERDQFRGALGGHDAAHLGAGQHVALGQGAFLEQFQGIGRKLHDGFGNGHTLGVGLGAHVHHGDVAVLVQMGKIVLHEAYPCIKSVPCCVAHGQAQGKAAGACRAGRERKMAGRKFFLQKTLARQRQIRYIHLRAEVVELVDTLGSGSSSGNGVGVRLSPSAPSESKGW